MKEFKGTKGTWDFCVSKIEPYVPFEVLVKGTGSMIASIYLKTKWDYDEGLTKLEEESKANAKLITAAPDLLEALQIVEKQSGII